MQNGEEGQTSVCGGSPKGLSRRKPATLVIKSGTIMALRTIRGDTVSTVEDTAHHLLVFVALPSGFTWDWALTPLNVGEEVQEAQAGLLRDLTHNAYRALLHLGLKEHVEIPSDSVRFFHRLARTYAKNLTRIEDIEHKRQTIHVVMSESEEERLVREAPFMPGVEHVNVAWLRLIGKGIEEAFHEDITGYPGTVSEYFQHWGADLTPPGRVFFHMVESKDEAYPFAFLATYAPEPEEGAAARHVPLKNALVEYQDNQDNLLRLLSTVSRAARDSAFVAGLLDSGEIFHPLRLTVEEAHTFLKEVPLYEAVGILCRIPKWWRGDPNRLRVTVNIGTKAPSRLGADAILDFAVQIALGDESVTLEEIQYLLQQTEGLAFLKGKWVEVNHDQLKAVLAAYEMAAQRGRSMGIIEALRYELFKTGDRSLASTGPKIEVKHGDWLNSLLERRVQLRGPKEVEMGPDFKAVLREYQSQGVTWLGQMRELGLGACLADDMGLGKTVQVLAWLNALRQAQPLRALLVVPASLLGNWMDEMARFTPLLRGYLVHPSAGATQDPREWGAYDVIVTTYGMLQRYSELRDTTWDVVVLDEAQAIKNPATKQAQTVKQLQAVQRIALTGTPIENRLSDLWSLFDFLNQGLLGTAAEFTQFTKALSDHPEGYGPLRRVVSPFILRRVKTDKTVIADLPDKIETTSFATLSRRQAALYLEVVQDVATKIQRVDGIERRGLILASLLKLKQICNHPDQYLGQSLFDPEESGKFARLEEITETIREKRERVLVFTQFKEMTEPLNDYLATLFNHRGLVLHGGTPVAQRRQLVTRFQSADYVPYMVLSIKAGGVGLNLTAANHVIHFDRWWNPAVENQATDRAFRIGQHKGVMVHKFVTYGTIEEKIDRLIQDKLQLSQEIIASTQEHWIGDLDNETLIDLLKLER